MTVESRETLLQEIQQTWEKAKTQLEQLKAAVAEHGKLAELWSRSASLAKERDQALHRLGEAVWREVERGKMVVPPSLTELVKPLRTVETDLLALHKEVQALLDEGREAADRQAAKKTGVAPKGKKR